LKKAIADINSANQSLADLIADGKLTPNEKQELKKEWDIIISEKPQIEATASAYGIETGGFNIAFDDLGSFLLPLLADLSVTSTADGDTLRANFKAYYDAKLVMTTSLNDALKVIIGEQD